jgi:hypothetical protein
MPRSHASLAPEHYNGRVAYTQGWVSPEASPRNKRHAGGSHKSSRGRPSSTPERWGAQEPAESQSSGHRGRPRYTDGYEEEYNGGGRGRSQAPLGKRSVEYEIPVGQVLPDHWVEQPGAGPGADGYNRRSTPNRGRNHRR